MAIFLVFSCVREMIKVLYGAVADLLCERALVRCGQYRVALDPLQGFRRARAHGKVACCLVPAETRLSRMWT
jgi:hypothetical protein